MFVYILNDSTECVLAGKYLDGIANGKFQSIYYVFMAVRAVKQGSPACRTTPTPRAMLENKFTRYTLEE